MTRRKKVIAAVPIAALALALAACSDSSSKSTSTPTTQRVSLASAPLEKAAYVLEANSICKEASDKSGALTTPGDPTKDPAQLAAWNTYLEQIVAINKTAIDQIKSLATPPGDEATIKRINDAADAHHRKLEAAQQAAASNDVSKLQAALDALETTSDTSKDAERYGLKCS